MGKVRGRRAEKVQERARERDVDSVAENTVVETPELEAQAPEGSHINTFFGLVDSNEIDYFKQAESTLNIDAFNSPQEKSGFIRSILEESKGKELKLVTNQICSKLFERLILGATDRQLKRIFKAFSGHYLALCHHKYASHVLETLLVRGTSLVEKELINGDKEAEEGFEEGEEEEENQEFDHVTMESMFINLIQELKSQMHEMIYHQYASHTLRLIILILAGRELPSTTTSNSTLRSKKSKIARKMIEIKDNEDFNRSFQTPPSFKNELRSLINYLIKQQDSHKLRELATHKVASPVIQLIVSVEGLVDKERSVWNKLFCNDGADAKESAFVEFLLSDPVGSHFLETVIRSGGARLKYLERLYNLYMKDRVLKLCKRSTTGVYIIQALMEKLKPREVEHILDALIPELSNLVSVNDNQNLDLGRSIIDASIARSNYRRDELIDQLLLKFAPSYKENPYDPLPEFYENTLQLAKSTLGNTRDDWPTAEERRRSLFLEKLMEYDTVFVHCSWLALLSIPSERFVQMCLHGVFSHVVENSLVVEPNETKPTQVLRKRLLNHFQGTIVTLACNAYGSHIVDKLWVFTVMLPMYKDRFAVELQEKSKVVKESIYGKLVWKNWSMELFLRKKYDWKSIVRQQEEQYRGDKKTPIELKMEALAQQKREQQEKAEKAEEGFLKRKLNQDYSKINQDFEQRQKKLKQDFENRKKQNRGRNRG